MPDWLAPNLITLIGILGILITILLTLIYSPNLTGNGPAWLYFFSAFSLFFYQTMDNIDGKHARKTGTSSPLGELFDHGIDSLNCAYGGIIQTAALGLGSNSHGAILVLMPCIAMYFSTWETYYTHTLYLGAINGPTEGIIFAIGTMALSGIYGTNIWNREVSKYFPFLQYFIPNELKLNELWVYIFEGSLVFLHIPFCIWNVYQATKLENDHLFRKTFLGLLPILIASSATYLWLQSPYSIILTHNHIVLFGLLASWIIGRLTTGIIFNHITRQKFPLWNSTLSPLIAGAVIFYILPAFGLIKHHDYRIETIYLWLFFLYAGINFMAWSINTINIICAYLNIRCLSLQPIDNKRSS